ncbi:cilia- and flagella-associated protein 100-like [Xyrichtys novacula]|uniref:Cilia- and flagella-associated protein 100-like n=1 Tax=Xyrichtys novacula TaxID=13765 RepID=A0AAV1FBJ2_XYRNO|nr:cilia- and flagella-associated protein 100-like [Xyrichtys novacula]
MSRRATKTQQTPFKVPDPDSIFQLSMNRRGHQKESVGRVLALPTDEMTTKLKMEVKTGPVEQRKEEKGEIKKLKGISQTKTRTVFHKQTTRREELKTAMMRKDAPMKDSKYEFITMERQKAILEFSLMMKKSAILEMDNAIAKEERQLKELETIIEKDNLKFEAVLRENEKKSVEARTFFELEAKSKQEKNVKIKKLMAKIGSIISELTKFEETLIDYKRYKELLFKLSPPEWQQAQRTEALKALSQDKGARDESAICSDLEPKDSTPGKELPSIEEIQLSPADSDTLAISSTLERDSSEFDNEPVLYFTDPQQLLDLIKELTEQNLSLIQNSSRLVETLEESRRSMDTTRKKIEKEEDQLTLQINKMIQKIDQEKAKGTKLKQRVELHVSLNTEDQDIMRDTLDEKVAEVHRCCVEDRITNLSTLEKLTNIEKHMFSLLQSIESIPEESLRMMKKIKDSERRSRHREQRLKEQREKQQERMKRYLEKSLADSKRTSTRKLMPRCFPVAQKPKVSHGDNTSAERDIHAFLLTPEDIH